MIKISADILMYFFEALLLYNYSNTLFDSPKSRKTRIISVGVVNIILLVLYELGIIWVNFVALIALYLFVFAKIFGTSFRSAVFHSVIFTAVMVASELVVIGISSFLFDSFNAMQSDIGAYIFVIVFSKIIYSTVILIIKRLFGSSKINDRQDKSSWFLFIVSFCNILVLCLFYYIANEYVLSDTIIFLICAVSVLLLFTNVAVCMIYEHSIKNLEQIHELQTLVFQQELDKKYLSVIEKQNSEMKHLKHDIKNHLLQIRYIDDIEDTHSYLDTLLDEVEKISVVDVSKNKILNLIISKYKAICEKKDIEFVYQIKMANLGYIDDVDLSTLFNNLLDNAVDAAEGCENAKIELLIFPKNKSFDGVIIRNTCKTAPITKKGELVTSKQQKQLHGYGLAIVKRIIEKYEVVYDWKYTEETRIFETDMALPGKR